MQKPTARIRPPARIAKSALALTLVDTAFNFGDRGVDNELSIKDKIGAKLAARTIKAYVTWLMVNTKECESLNMTQETPSGEYISKCVKAPPSKSGQIIWMCGSDANKQGRVYKAAPTLQVFSAPVTTKAALPVVSVDPFTMNKLIQAVINILPKEKIVDVEHYEENMFV